MNYKQSRNRKQDFGDFNLLKAPNCNLLWRKHLFLHKYSA